MANERTRNVNKSLTEYTLRVSPRAKHVCIKVSHVGEVEVVIPKGFDRRKLPAILEKRRDWIAKTIQHIEAERKSLQSEQPDSSGLLPEKIVLRAIAEDWEVNYLPTHDLSTRVITTNQTRLLVQGQMEPPDLCQEVLKRWLSRKARLHLEPWLRQISHEIDLPFNHMSVRGQRTLWASCSSRKNISLNYKLLFLPAPLVRYVFIHELCHTIHLNHSEQFWALVGEKDPDYDALDRELRKAWRYVPEWVERSEQDS